MEDRYSSDRGATFRSEGTNRATSANVQLPCLQKDLRTGSISRDIVNFPSELYALERHGYKTNFFPGMRPGARKVPIKPVLIWEDGPGPWELGSFRYKKIETRQPTRSRNT